MGMKKTIVLILIMSVLLSTTGCHKAVPRQPIGMRESKNLKMKFFKS